MPGRRDRAHLEPGRRAAARALLPPHLTRASRGSDAMRILLWHGYLLGGHRLERLHAGARARVEPRRARRDRRLPGARSPSSTTSAARRGRRPELPGGLLPVFVLDATRGSRRGCCRTSAPRSARRYVEANAAALRELLPADLVFTNHVLLGGAVGAALGVPLPRQGARLGARVLDARPARARGVGAGVARAGGGGLRRLAAHPRGARGRRRPRRAGVRGAARASTSTSSCRRTRAEALAELLAEARGRPAEPRQRRASGCPTRATRSGSPTFLAGDAPTVVYFGKLIENKGVQLLLEALDGARCARGDRRLRRLPRRARAAGRRAAGERVLFTGPLEHRHLVHLLPLADAAVVPSIFPEAFGMVAAEAAAVRLPAARRPPLRARRGRRRARGRRTRRTCAHLAAFATGDAADLRREARPSCSRSARPTARRSAPLRGATVERALVVGGRGRALARAGRVAFRPHGRGTASLCRGAARDRPRGVRGRHRLHPRGRGGVRAARSRDALARQPLRGGQGGRGRAPTLEPHLVGELIASEAEVRTGKCADFGEAAAKMAERRAQLQALARELGLQLGATGTHPWSRWQDQRIIDTPHYRRNDELLRYVVWRNNTFGLHVHVGIRGGDRAIAVCNAMRNFLPELLALSASSPFVEEVDSGPPLGPHADLHPHVPALRDPRRLRRLAGVRGLRRVPLPHRLDQRAHPALVERAAAPRLPDGRDPDLRRPARPRRGAEPRGARLRARRPLRARPRRGRAAARPAAPAARGEPLAGDPLRALRAS